MIDRITPICILAIVILTLGVLLGVAMATDAAPQSTQGDLLDEFIEDLEDWRDIFDNNLTIVGAIDRLLDEIRTHPDMDPTLLDEFIHDLETAAGG